MAGFAHVLVGVDFSEASLEAVRQALHLARRDGGRVTVVHVAGAFVPPEAWPELWSSPSPTSAQEVLKATRAHMERWLAPLSGEPALDAEVIAGEAVERMLELAAGRGCDLLMVSATGRGALERFLVGSTAEALARRASLPLWVVRGGAKEAIKRVLVGVDLGPVAAEATRCALAQANREGAALEVAHVWQDPSHELAFALASAEDQQRYREQVLHRAQERFAAFCHDQLPDALSHGLAPARWLVAGEPAAALVGRAEQSGADLLVVGRRSYRPLRELILGSTAERVLRSAPCHVLVTRAPTGAGA
jgi:nucleotide-binding universal stress UspA family protein